MRDKVIRQPKKKPTEKECYAELARAVRIYCYQAVVHEEIGFFRRWVGDVLKQLEEYTPAPGKADRYAAYEELKFQAYNFVNGGEDMPEELFGRRIGMRRALEKAEG